LAKLNNGMISKESSFLNKDEKIAGIILKTQ